MAILTEAELVLGLSRHLGAYAVSTERAALGNLEFAGQVLDMASRLRGSTTSPASRVHAIGLDVGLVPRLLNAVLVTLEHLGWVSLSRDSVGTLLNLSESIPTIPGIINEGPRLLQMVAAAPIERAALALLRATSLQPLLVIDALALAAKAADDSDQIAEDAQRYLTALGLVRRVRADDGSDVLYNPNVWTQGDTIASAALRAADARATAEVTALLEEVAASPGMPEAHVTSTEPRWVSFAITQGLVQRSVIQTTEGVEQGFLFTPHVARDPFGQTAGDASGQVRQLVGSMVYATTFAKFKLQWPDVFLRRLLRDGIAGDVTSIGTDYPMLERAGIIRVLPGTSSRRFQMQLLQPEIAQDALDLITSRDSGTGSPAVSSVLSGQRSYVHVEHDRARLALTTATDDVEQARLLAALREVTTQRAIRGAR